MEKNSSSLRVLVVDDEALIRWSVAQTLSGVGHEVLEAADGHGAVEVLRDGCGLIDVVVLDFRLPDSSDLGLLSLIRQQWPTTQIILMTAHGSPEVARGALDLGAFQVVPKPFELCDIVTLVVQACSSRPH